MKKDYCLLRRCWRWCCRFRQRCGYGIHSPFAFTLVTDVIYNRGQYYAYETALSPSLGGQTKNASSFVSLKDLRLLFRLCNQQRAQHIAYIGKMQVQVEQAFRAARSQAVLHTYIATTIAQNVHHFDLVYLHNAEDLTVLLERGFFVVGKSAGKEIETETATTATAPTITDTMKDEREGATMNRHKAEREQFTKEETACSPAQFLPTAASVCLVIVRGIHRTPQSRQAWANLLHSDCCTLSFDLYRFGLVYWRPQLHKQNYVINYF